jgi:hypothetical protein
MAPLLGAAPAVVASLVIQIGYVVSLMASFLLYMHPMRTNVAEMIWPPPDVAAGQGAAPAGRRGSDDEGGGGAGVEAGAAAAGVGAGRAAEMEARHYHVLTYSLLAAATLAAVSVPSECAGGAPARAPPCRSWCVWGAVRGRWVRAAGCGWPSVALIRRPLLLPCPRTTPLPCRHLGGAVVHRWGRRRGGRGF